jgi:hypothetical protein
MVPLAPGRLSTMNCWPMLSDSRCAIVRATASTVPPGGYGTTMRTTLLG